MLEVAGAEISTEPETNKSWGSYLKTGFTAQLRYGMTNDDAMMAIRATVEEMDHNEDTYATIIEGLEMY